MKQDYSSVLPITISFQNCQYTWATGVKTTQGTARRTGQKADQRATGITEIKVSYGQDGRKIGRG